MKPLISAHLLLLVVSTLTTAYAILRHKFFITDRKRTLLVIAAMLLLFFGSEYLPPKESEAILTFGNAGLIYIYAYTAVCLPTAVLRIIQSWQHYKSGKWERDRNEIRK